MAEFKTYVCDICGKQEAIHIVLPYVDHEADPSGGHDHKGPGSVDLCADHLKVRLEKLFGVKSQKEQRDIWKYLHGVIHEPPRS